MKPSKFNFIPESQIRSEPLEDTLFRVTLHKNGSLRLSHEYVQIYELDNKFIRVYADLDKQTIGWSILEKNIDMSSLKGVRLIKKNKTNGICIGIKKLLKAMKYELKGTMSKIEVKVYKSPLHEHEIHYIELKK